MGTEIQEGSERLGRMCDLGRNGREATYVAPHCMGKTLKSGLHFTACSRILRQCSIRLNVLTSVHVSPNSIRLRH
jgi:hypothetical protein